MSSRLVAPSQRCPWAPRGLKEGTAVSPWPERPWTPAPLVDRCPPHPTPGSSHCPRHSPTSSLLLCCAPSPRGPSVRDHGPAPGRKRPAVQGPIDKSSTESRHRDKTKKRGGGGERGRVGERMSRLAPARCQGALPATPFGPHKPLLHLVAEKI